MKNLKLLTLFLACGFIFSSCEDDDSTKSTFSTSDMVGTWDLTGLETDQTATTNFMGQDITTTSTNTLVSSNLTFTFNDDGTYSSTGTYTLRTESPGLPAQEQTLDGTSTGTYDIDGNELMWNGVSTVAGQSSGTSIIRSLTANKLVIEQSVDDTFDVNGFEAHVVVDGLTTLER